MCCVFFLFYLLLFFLESFDLSVQLPTLFVGFRSGSDQLFDVLVIEMSRPDDFVFAILLCEYEEGTVNFSALTLMKC